MKVQIKSRYDRNVSLFECEVPDDEPNPVRAAVAEATAARANLTGANLTRANLAGAYLAGANLAGTNLTEANLAGTNLDGANLTRANLAGAYLAGANLDGAKNADLAIAMTSITPAGALIVWKKCRDGVLVRLRVPDDARRSNATGRKCRSERVEVLEVVGAGGKPVEVGVSGYDDRVTYRVGHTVTAHHWDENRWNECGGGIHFLLTKAEAEAYKL